MILMYNIRDTNILQECHPINTKRKFKQQWLTILAMPTTTIHIPSLKNTKKTTTYAYGCPDLVLCHAQKCGGVKEVNVIPILLLLITGSRYK